MKAGGFQNLFLWSDHAAELCPPLGGLCGRSSRPKPPEITPPQDCRPLLSPPGEQLCFALLLRTLLLAGRNEKRDAQPTGTLLPAVATEKPIPVVVAEAQQGLPARSRAWEKLQPIAMISA